MKFRTWYTYLRSRLSRRNRQLEPVASEAVDRGKAMAREMMEREYTLLGVKELVGPEEGALLTAEMWFLWGVFHEFVQEYPDLPTNGFDRIKLHLAAHLQDTRQIALEEAIDAANAVEATFNRANPLFDAVAAVGKEAFHDETPGYFAQAVVMMRDGGRPPA